MATAGTIERIVLVGLSGSGKSTVAAHLARALGWAAADTDDWIVEAAGRSIASIFSDAGEAAFREWEHRALRALAARPNLVLATGGGIVTVEANWPLLRQQSLVVWLRTSTDQLLARLAAPSTGGSEPAAVRPLLAGDAAARLASMQAERVTFYARADLVVDTDGLTPQAVAAAIATRGGVPPITRPDTP